MNQTTNTDYNETNIRPTDSVAGRLPAEILRMILYQLVGCDPSTNPNFFDNVPHQLCRVNRHWNQAFTPFLYAHYRFSGEANQIKSLWCFLRTLYTNPETAKYVRYLVLTEQRPNLDYPNGKKLDEALTSFSRENLHWVRTALSDAGLGGLKHLPEETLLLVDKWPFISCMPPPLSGSQEHLYKLYTRVLTALVAAHCPNLLRLHLQFSWFDPFTECILRHATASYHPAGTRVPRRLAFQNLNTLTIGETHMIKWEGFLGTYNHYQRLPKLKELVVLHGVVTSSLQPRRSNIAAEAKRQRPPSAIERVTLGFTQFETKPFGSYLRLTPNLKQLTVNFNSIYRILFPRADPEDYSGFWKVLQTFQSQLEFLDVFENRGKDIGFCTSLAEFSKLRCLAVLVRLITGGPCNHGEYTKIQSHLPPNIESLGLYEQVFSLYGGNHWFAHELRGIGTWAREPGRKIQAIYCEWYNFGGEALRTLTGLEDREDIVVHDIEHRAFFRGGEETVAAHLPRFPNDLAQVVQAEFLNHRARYFIPRGMVVHDQAGLLSICLIFLDVNAGRNRSSKSTDSYQEVPRKYYMNSIKGLHIVWYNYEYDLSSSVVSYSLGVGC